MLLETVDRVAARYLAARLKDYRAKGAGPGGGYLQPVQFRTPTYAAAPSLSVGAVRLASLADRLMSIGQRELDASGRERHAELLKTADLSLAALDALRQSVAAGDAAQAG